jgi:uncharacterized protein YjdB
MMPLNFRRRAALGASAGVLALCLAACSERPSDSTGPAQGTALQLGVRSAVAGGTPDAYAKIDAAHVTLTRASAILLDTVVSFAGGGDGHIDLSVRLADPSGTLVVAVELRSRGQVLFLGTGTAELRRGATTSLPLTVSPVIAGLVAPDSATLTALGDTVRLRAAAVFATGDTVTGTSIPWVGDGGSVIRVASDGLVTALREGQAQATASYQSFTRTTRVRVQAVVTRVVLSADTFSLLVDSTRTLTAVARDRNGNVLPRTIAWRSSNAAVATVDANGVVRGIAPGTDTITASSEAQSASAVVTVRRVPVAAVRVAPPAASLLVGGTIRLVATTLDAAGAVLPGRIVTWSTSNAGIATVDASGLVRAIAVGSAVVTATSEGRSGTATIEVAQPLVAASPTEVAFSVLEGSEPTTQTVAVTNAGGGTLGGLYATVEYTSGAAGWLTPSFSSTTAPTTLSLTAHSDSLTAGTYTATVIIASTVPGAGSVPVSVELVVSSAGNPIILPSASQVNLFMNYDTLGVAVHDSVSVDNEGTGTLTGLSVIVTYDVDGPTGWLSASLDSGTAPTMLRLTAQGIVEGSAYHAIVTISSTVPGVASVQIDVYYYDGT